jgi:hypothetical protein
LRDKINSPELFGTLPFLPSASFLLSWRDILFFPPCGISKICDNIQGITIVTKRIEEMRCSFLHQELAEEVQAQKQSEEVHEAKSE